MKIKIKIFFIVFLAFFSLLSQAQISRHEIKWNDVETWSTGKMSKRVISFEDAQYSTPDYLPYFNQQIKAENNSTYLAKVDNIEYVSLNEEEERLISEFSVPEVISIESYYTNDRGVKYINFQFLPFVRKDNKVLKIKNFDLIVEKQAAASKAPKAPEAPEAITRSYAQNSVLATGKFVKVRIKESGIYKLTYEALNSMGINPANVRVFGYGGALLDQDLRSFKPDDLPEVAVWMEKGADGIFNAGDYILFYGQGIISWDYDADEKIFVHKQNHYSKEGFYFITSDVGIGKRFEEVSVSLPEGAEAMDVTEFVDYQVYDVDKINLGSTGKVFYADEFNISPLSYNYSFSFPNITTADVKAKINVATIAGEASSFTLKLNDMQGKNIPLPRKASSVYEIGKGYTGIFTFMPTNPELNFSLSYNKPSAGGKGYLNYLAVNVRRTLVMTGSVMFFRNPDNLQTSKYNHYRISEANEKVQVWDITDPSNIKRVITERRDDVLEFYSSNQELREYVAIDPTAKSAISLEPVSMGVVPNQNLHGMAPAEFVILTHPDFLQQAEKLANAHRQYDQISVNVITTEQVYNEFSSGTADATSIRWAMKKWYDETDKQFPKYLLLFGRGSYDNRSIIHNSGDNFIPTYQADESLDLVDSYLTDDYFGFLDEGEGLKHSISSDAVDLGIGRFPVMNRQQAEDVVNKNIIYLKNEMKGNWKNQLAFLADDGDGGLHMRDMDRIVEEVKPIFPAYQYNKIYLDAFKQETTASGDSYPLAKTKLHTLLNSGLFMLNFMGHAGPFGWTNEGVLSEADVKGMYNTKFPFWVAATCDFVLFDVKKISAGEYVLLNSVGGGIGLYSAARVVYAHENAKLNRLFILDLFAKNSDGTYPRLGDAVRTSKNQAGGGINKLSYVLLGNPVLRLNYPSPYKVITEKLNDNLITEADTLKALSVDKFTGYIADENNQKVTDFNGVVEISVYDKIQKITTLNNHNDGGIVFEDRPNILYSGKANVTDGSFNFTLMVPRDIRYNYGNGRINYYASDATTAREAQGYFESFLVGGSTSEYVQETEGPDVEMYLNTPSFTSGGKVNETPLFVAKISDINGINTIANGIGHDLRLVIDDNPFNSHIMNEYFEADTDSYQAGTVRVKLPRMEAGKHKLTFYVWDLLNNSSTSTLDFEVVPGLKPEIFSVSNYPNPAKSSTVFVVEHDRPEVILATTLEVFDVSGRLVYVNLQESTEDFRWDLTDASGKRLQPGVYIYKISISTGNSKMTSKGNKIIVLGQ